MPSMDNSHALIIGIANYENINQLPQTVLKDSQDMYNTLIDPCLCAYPPTGVELLLDKKANRESILQAMATCAKVCNKDSTFLFYISCHGGFIESGANKGAYLLTVDANCTSECSIAETAISSNEFTKALRAIPARKLVAIFDCCHSGGIGYPKAAGGVILKTGLPEAYYEHLKEGRGRVIMASSRSSEYSWIMPGAQNSLFTHYLLEGLKGGAPAPGGVVRIFDIFHYLQPKVTFDKSSQHPLFKAEIEDNFPIALSQGGGARTMTPIPSKSPKDDFQYDVFISYRQKDPDKEWVKKTLLPSLEKRSLRVFIDFRHFRLGAPLVTEMVRAVEQSRYTLSILSPLYLESDFTKLENILAAHLGLEQGKRRLLALMLQECNPRLDIRARLWLDMTNKEEFEANIQRLVYELRLPPDK